jgi:CheY-like chemotaxis protein
LRKLSLKQPLTPEHLFQSRIVQAEKLASLGQRVLGVVHELSNPLTSILGNAQRLVQRYGATGEFPEARHILQEAERACAILRQMLFLSRDSQANPQLLSLGKLIEQTVDLQRSNLATGDSAGAAIQFCVEGPADLPAIEGDYLQLQQVLLNLLQNAQHAIEHSGRGSTIGVRTGPGPGGQVQLEVWDDGPGVPENIQNHIFDPFFTTKPPGVGTGLGLPIVLGFVRQHGGTVTCLQRPQGGSRFLIELPAAQERNRFALVSPAIANSKRILVVEDEPTVATLIADVLRDEGFQLDVLQDGQAALQQTELQSYDLAICDMHMPGLDGQAFYRALLQANNPLHQRVLFVTGDVLAPRARRFLEKHQLRHLAKPFRVEELSRAVGQALGQKKSAASAGGSTGQNSGTG